jgi:hypothetical protein
MTVYPQLRKNHPVVKATMSEPRRVDRLESGITIGVPPAMAPRANWKGFLRLSRRSVGRCLIYF